MLRGGTSVVLVQFPNVSVHPFNAGDEVVDPVVNPVMYERILVVDVPCGFRLDHLSFFFLFSFILVVPAPRISLFRGR
jgi:hypothetical protein